MEEFIKGTSVSVILRWISILENLIDKDKLFVPTKTQHKGCWDFNKSEGEPYNRYLVELFQINIIKGEFTLNNNYQEYVDYARISLLKIRKIINGQ